MIAENRDPDFWREVARDPAVSHIAMGLPFDIGVIAVHPSVLPLASANGGFLFCKLDGLGRVFELHTLFKPAGWGREVHDAALLAFAQLFEAGAKLITTYEVPTWARPPRTFGWRPIGDLAPTEHGPMRTWLLTLDAWDASPARQRMQKCP